MQGRLSACAGFHAKGFRKASATCLGLRNSPIQISIHNSAEAGPMSTAHACVHRPGSDYAAEPRKNCKLCSSSLLRCKVGMLCCKQSATTFYAHGQNRPSFHTPSGVQRAPTNLLGGCLRSAAGHTRPVLNSIHLPSYREPHNITLTALPCSTLDSAPARRRLRLHPCSSCRTAAARHHRQDNSRPLTAPPCCSALGEIRLVAVLSCGHALLDAQQQRGLPGIQARHIIILSQAVGERLAVSCLACIRQVLTHAYTETLSFVRTNHFPGVTASAAGCLACVCHVLIPAKRGHAVMLCVTCILPVPF